MDTDVDVCACGLAISPDGEAWALVTRFRHELFQAHTHAEVLQEFRRQAWELIVRHNLAHETKVALGEILEVVK